MDNLVREYNNIKMHFAKEMQNQKRVWKNLRNCLNVEYFTSPFSEEKVYKCGQVWTSKLMGFKLDKPLSKQIWRFWKADNDIILIEIYSNLDPP